MILFSVVPAIMIPLVENGNEVAIVIIAIVLSIILSLFVTVVTIFTYPIMLRSGLMMDFKAGFSWSFMKGFAAKVGLSMIGYYILLTIIAIPLMLLGYLALLVGVYVVAAWMQFAMMHLAFQHYDLMIERGGERLDVNPEVTKNFGVPPLPTSPAEENASS
jgi:hypothetical protein